jgi:hypothetical protein
LAISFRFHAGGVRLPTHPAERDRSSVLAVVRAHALDLPVAIRMTWTALPITSAGRRSPRGNFLTP